MNYEFGLTVRTDRFYGRAQAFNAEFRDPIVRRTLLFPADRIPAALAGIPVTPIAQTAAQRQQGVVTVATAFDPRAVKAFVNDGQSRYYGFEAIVRFQASPRWSFDGNYSFLAGRDLNPNRPARRLPPQQAFAAVRYAPSGRWWGELSGAFAGAQRRLSAGDLDDERIGASRRRSDIAGFFRSAIVNQYLSAGADGRMGTADDLFTPTGETLSQIQNRVLPLGAVINGVAVLNDNTRVPLFRQTDSWVTLNVRGGVALKESLNLTFGVMNVLDRNYRIHGSGIDASGANAFIGIKLMF